MPSIEDILPKIPLSKPPSQGRFRTALEMGYAGKKVLHSKYKELISPKKTTAYWQIVPTSQATNVISFMKTAS